MDRCDHWWTGYAAFMVGVGKNSSGLTLRTAEQEYHPFQINDEKRLPEVLHADRWGNTGHTTWYSDPQAAIEAVLHSKSRGQGLLKADEPHAALQPWLVFELILSSGQLCSMVNDYKFLPTKGLADRPLWRLSGDICIDDVFEGGGALQKSLHGPHGQKWGRIFISPSSNVETGMCCCCRCRKDDFFLFEKQCHACWSTSMD
jgi:hypothetical protein